MLAPASGSRNDIFRSVLKGQAQASGPGLGAEHGFAEVATSFEVALHVNFALACGQGWTEAFRLR